VPLNRSLAATLLTGVLVLPALAACGGSDDKPGVVILDTKRVEAAIEQSILQQRDVKADVDCPAGVHQGTGLTFRCSAKTSKGVTVFVVSQTDDRGNVTYRAL
jgi:hypothetical protein